MAPKSLPLLSLIEILGTVACQPEKSAPDAFPTDTAAETTAESTLTNTFIGYPD